MSADPWIGQQLGAYQIIDLIGRGGMGAVYRALHPVLERYAAIKFLRADREGEPTGDERFLREARAVSRLRHPHIVQLYDFGAYEAGYYMILEYIPGVSLHQRLSQLAAQHERLPLDDAARILDKVADALTYVHRQGMVHRDIKPGNILLNTEGEAILSDFGIVRLVSDDQASQTGSFVGTPAYMAPEQAQGLATDHRADLYALGVVAYEILAGRPPFVGDSSVGVLLKHLQEPAPSPREFNPSLPPTLDVVLLKALAKSPADRYANIAAFRHALHEAIGGTSTPAASRIGLDTSLRPTPQPLTPPSTSRLPFLHIAVLGRRTEINDLKNRLTHPPALVTVVGLGGLGKTTIALAAAHELAAENAYPDGIFWIDGQEQTSLGAVMAELAALLKLDLDQQTLSQQRRALAFHFTGRRALIVLDNLETLMDEGAVLEFLSELPCAALTTSRNRPATGHLLELAPLPAQAAFDLLRASTGMEVLDDSARALCEQDLEGHPLAIEVVGALVSAGLDLNEVREYLRQTPMEVLSEKTMGGGRSLLEALQLSFSRLSPLTQTIFIRASIFPADFDVAALAVLSPEHSRLQQVKALRELSDRSLLNQVSRQSYRLHSVTRQFAYAKLDEPRLYHRRAGAYYLTESGRDTLAATEQLLRARESLEAARLVQQNCAEWMNAGYASRALGLLERLDAGALPNELQIDIAEVSGDVLALLGQSAEALARYQRTLPNVTSPETLARLKRKVGELLRRQQPAEAIEWFEQALTHLGNATSLEVARIAIRLGAAWRRQGHPDKALEWEQRGLNLARQLNEPVEIAEANINLGALFSVQGDYAQAITALEEALTLLRGLSNRHWMTEAAVLSNLASIHHDQGRWTQALDCHAQSLQLEERLGNADGIATTCFNLGHIYALTGDFNKAAENLKRCLSLWERDSSDYGIAATHMNLGLLRLRQGQLAEAEKELITSEAQFQVIESQDFLPEVYRLRSEVALAQNQAETARAYAQRSLESAQTMGVRMEEGATRRALGLALAAADQPEAALAELNQSMTILTEQGNDYELARAQHALGLMLQRDPQSTHQGLSYLHQSAEAFERLGALPDLKLVRQSLARPASAQSLPPTVA